MIFKISQFMDLILLAYCSWWFVKYNSFEKREISLTRLNIVGLYGITKQNHERAMCNSNPIQFFSLMYVSGSVKSYLLQLGYTLATKKANPNAWLHIARSWIFQESKIGPDCFSIQWYSPKFAPEIKVMGWLRKFALSNHPQRKDAEPWVLYDGR